MGNMNESAAREAWALQLRHYVQPYWSEVLNSEWAEALSQRRLSLQELQGWALQLFPFIHAFPKFLAEALIKVEDEYARTFLINNIRVEKSHADHWLAMGEGLGVPRDDMLALADGRKPVLRDVQSLTDWLWYVNTKGSLAEAVAATSFAIEGMTGDLARKTIEGFLAYENEPGVTFTRASTRWMREHAHYDDDHPIIALEVVKNYAVTERLRQKAMLASRRSIQLLGLAFETAYRAYTPAKVKPVVTTDLRRGDDRRAGERRHGDLSVSFPDRRLRDRRGFHTQRVH
jgi:pyrroloquinoline quinone (PQQ) biosynthesis protein C